MTRRCTKALRFDSAWIPVQRPIQILQGCQGKVLFLWQAIRSTHLPVLNETLMLFRRFHVPPQLSGVSASALRIRRAKGTLASTTTFLTEYWMVATSCCANGEKTWVKATWSDLYSFLQIDLLSAELVDIEYQPESLYLDAGSTGRGRDAFLCSNSLFLLRVSPCFPVLLLCKLLSRLMVWSSNSACQCSVPGRWSLASGVEARSSHRICKCSSLSKLVR